MADWTLVLWRRNGPEDFDALAAEGYRLFSLFREGEGGPAFETVWNRSQAKPFPWTEEGVEAIRAWLTEKLEARGSQPYRIWSGNHVRDGKSEEAKA